MREISLDTETTGFDPLTGDKIVEIGCVELINHVPTDNNFHVYLNPERSVPEDSIRVHGLTDEFLADKQVFSEVATDFLEFIGDSALVIHNAAFDMKFLNVELKSIGFPELKNEIIDTLLIARQRFPGSPANLDALCRRFSIDNSNRTLHGALLDAELLAEVYLELCGGRQPGFLGQVKSESKEKVVVEKTDKIFREPRIFALTDEEKQKHETMLGKIKDSSWN